MDHIYFKKILKTFADKDVEIDLERGQLIVQVHDNIIEATLLNKLGNIYVKEDEGEPVSAERWIIDRIARLRQLADRMLDYIDENLHFVTPVGTFLDQLDHSPDEKQESVPDVVCKLQQVLSRPLGAASSVIYITSDAGEGKTTVINKLARDQAQLYKEGKADWLLLPISLGGRTFLRLDDVAIGSLVNKFRFHLLNYDSLMALSRMGVIVLALDGFEEMFVETASGDAISALGNLVHALDSSGTVLVAARKAYFEYQSINTQSILYESLGKASVAFSKISLQRWEKSSFITYCEKRALPDGKQVYKRVSEILGPEHPVLTRAILVKRLVDVLEDTSVREDFYSNLLKNRDDSTTEFFDQFVNTIIEREVDKWIDKVGTPARPLLTLEQHHKLLSDIAEEMWVSSTSSLRADVMDFLSEIFCETLGLRPDTVRQVVERTKQHSLISSARDQGKSFGFDHEEFFHFFLGKALSNHVLNHDYSNLRVLTQNRTLPSLSIDIAVHNLRLNDIDGRITTQELSDICKSEARGSCMRENCGAIVCRLLTDTDGDEVSISNMEFPSHSLRARIYNHLSFTDCFFYPSSLEETSLNHVSFKNCEFQRLILSSTQDIETVSFTKSTIHSLRMPSGERELFDPDQIAAFLVHSGFIIDIISDEVSAQNIQQFKIDNDLALCDRALRPFWRATEVNENVFRVRLGQNASLFLSNVLPALLDNGILKEVGYRGKGKQSRYRLAVPLEAINNAYSRSSGRFVEFIRILS